MAEGNNRPGWVDLASADAAASRDFYGALFGWDIEVNQDPQYGGYALARINGNDVAGIGPKMDPNSPTAWNVYIDTDDIDGQSAKVAAAGGTVVMAPFDVGDQGRMAVYQDPTGAYISGWQAARMRNFEMGQANELGWVELNANGVAPALEFYPKVFGWEASNSGNMGGYTEFKEGGESIAGAQDMPQGMPPGVPSFWLAYFNVTDVDATASRAAELGGSVMAPPMDFPGGRFAIIVDPQGGSFGLLKMQAG
jgi:predicted enzyme related to lactoylglutathione lyase